MFEQYFGMDIKRFGYFSGMVAGVALIVTIIYWAVFGFDRWKEEVRMASDLIMAASVAPVAQAPAGPGVAGQYVCPQHGAVGLPNLNATGVPHCPVCGQVMGFYSARSNRVTLAATGGG